MKRGDLVGGVAINKDLRATANGGDTLRSQLYFHQCALTARSTMYMNNISVYICAVYMYIIDILYSWTKIATNEFIHKAKSANERAPGNLLEELNFTHIYIFI